MKKLICTFVFAAFATLAMAQTQPTANATTSTEAKPACTVREVKACAKEGKTCCSKMGAVGAKTSLTTNATAKEIKAVKIKNKAAVKTAANKR